MNRYAANCDRNCPCSDVWWPWIGSKIDAMLMPTWVSRMLPAAPIAQNTMPKQKPMAMPMNSSLSAIGARSAIDIPVSGRPASATGSATTARLTRKLLRTIDGMFCWVSSGSMMKAPEMRGRVRPSASSGLPRNCSNCMDCGCARASVPDHAGGAGEDPVGEGVQRAADQRDRPPHNLQGHQYVVAHHRRTVLLGQQRQNDEGAGNARQGQAQLQRRVAEELVELHGLWLRARVSAGPCRGSRRRSRRRRCTACRRSAPR